ncbi:hypothetical protein HU830_04470 [Lactobacillus sp. DCY120]|uniref:Uncharacterized protein n=1 Tax=Bombilactobacillus apium TaxID=2675299 RepID=A0A850RAR7_9LACO|nr:hypothetical protein [Bombilactobacillus apium]NVY96426.1 hypothetical protein [Bombilactobacillus apium]
MRPDPAADSKQQSPVAEGDSQAPANKTTDSTAPATPNAPANNKQQQPAQQQGETQTGATASNANWKANFEKSLKDNYNVTPSKYVNIGNGYWQVWVKEADTGAYPYITVNQNTGNCHG